MKKVFSILLACVMAFSMLTVLASAGTVNNAVLQISIEPTQEQYSKGDVVKFEVFYTSSDELGLMGCPFSFSVGFDNRVFETIEDIQDYGNYEQHTQTVLTVGYPVDNNIVKAFSWSHIYGSERLTDVDTAKGWNSVFFTSMTPINGCDDDYSSKKASFAFQLRIKEDAPDDGCYTLGITDYSIQNFQTEINEEIGAIAGPSGPDYTFSTDYIFETIDAKVEVATVAASILQWSKAQIRFKGIAQDGAKADYQGTFDVRTVAKISEADFIAKFGSDEAAKSAITDLGFVYMINGESFDYATAVEVANGASATGYTKKSVSYIQHAGAGEDYIFTCLITDNPDAAKNDTLTCIAFVKTADETIVFDAPSTVNYSDLYGLMPT